MIEQLRFDREWTYGISRVDTVRNSVDATDEVAIRQRLALGCDILGGGGLVETSGEQTVVF